MKEEIIFYQLYAEYFTKKNAFSASMKKITSDIIDGTHVAIIRPNVHERQYYNTKVFHSLTVIIVTLILNSYFNIM